MSRRGIPRDLWPSLWTDRDRTACGIAVDILAGAAGDCSGMTVEEARGWAMAMGVLKRIELHGSGGAAEKPGS